MARLSPRRLLAIAALILFAVLAAAPALLVGLALYTESGTRLAAGIALRWYDSSIPGKATVGSVAGCLGDRFTLGDVSLLDRKDNRLIQARKIEIEWSPLSLVQGRLPVERLEIRGVEIHLEHERDGAGFADLAPRETSPAPEAPRYGPDLPFALQAEISLEDATVSWRGPEGGEKERGHVSELELALTASGTEAKLVARRVSGSVPGRGAADLEFEAIWAEPIATLSDLRARSDRGGLSIREAVFDVDRQEGAADAFVDLDPAFLDQRWDLPTREGVSLALSVAGSPGSLEASAAVLSGPEVAIEAEASGSALPEIDLEGTVDFSFAGIRAVMGGRFLNGVLDRACATVTVADLSVLASELEGRVDLPELEGEFSLQASCDRAKGTLTCRGDARGRELSFDGKRRERIARLDVEAEGTEEELEISLRATGARGNGLSGDATVELGDGVSIALHRLHGKYKDSAVRLARPSLVVFRDDSLSIRDLYLGFAGGELSVSGEIRRRGMSDLRARVSRLRLERLPEGLVGRGTAGRVDLSLEMIGELERPSGYLRGTVMGLAWRGELLGDLRVDARHDGARLVVDGELENAGIESARLFASAPLRLSLAKMDAALEKHLPLELRLRLRGVELERLDPFAPGLDLDGQVDVRLSIEGTTSSPRGTLEVSGRKLARREVDLGEAKVFASFSRDHLYFDLDCEGGIARSLKLTAEAELARSPLEAGAVRMARGGTNDVKLVARGLRLENLRAVLPGVDVAGVVDVDARLDGSPENPDGWLEITSSRVDSARVTTGPIRIFAEHRDGTIVAKAHLRGGPAREIDLSAEIPLQIALDAPPRWWPERPHELNVEAHELDLSALRRIAVLHGIEIGDLPVDGMIGVSAAVRGTPADPVVDATLTSDNLSWGSHRLGATAVRLELGQGQARLQANIVQAEGRWANLVASAPYTLDVEPFHISWDHRGAHSIRLRAVGVDKAVLAPLWEAPTTADVRLDIELGGDGNAEDLALNGKWSGNLSAEGVQTMPLRGELVADFRNQFASLELGHPGAPIASISARSEITVDELLRDEGRLEDALIAAEVRMPGLELRRFKSFLPGYLYGIEGVLSAEIDVDGTIGAPRPTGTVELKEGAITVVELGQRLRGVELRAEMDGHQIRVTDLRFSSGQGRGSARGAVSFAGDGEVRGTLDATLEQFPLVKPGLPDIALDSDIGLSFASARRSAEAAVTLRSTRVRLFTRQRSRAPKEIPRTDMFTFASGGDGAKVAGAAIDPPADPVDRRPMKLAIDVTDPIEITGPDVNMRWGGRVDVSSAAGRNEVTGGIQAERGRFWLLGNTFAIDSGNVSLPTSGSLDPYIRLVARAETREALVIVQIRGRLSRPELTLTSDPVMTQYQILTLLLTGRSDTGEGGEDGDEIQAQAASMLLAFSNPALERQLNDRLGVDRIGLSMGQSVDEPVLAVGKRLGRHFYVETEYHHNAPSTENRAGGRVEYYIDPRWSIETFYGDANKGGIDLFWRKRFGRSKTRRRTLPDESGDDRSTDEE